MPKLRTSNGFHNFSTSSISIKIPKWYSALVGIGY